MSAFYKGLSGVALFISISIMVKYLNVTAFGFWVMIYTLLQWVLLMDFGLSSVLKTKIPEFKSKNQPELIEPFIQQVFFLSIKTGLVLFTVLEIIFHLVDIKSLFNLAFDIVFIRKILSINLVFFVLNFIVHLQKALFVSFFKGMYSEQSIAINQIFFLTALISLDSFFDEFIDETKLLILSITSGTIMFIVNLVYLILIFKWEKLNFKLFFKKHNVKIYGWKTMGGKFMFTQVLTLVLFSSDPFLVSYYFNLEEVASYEVVSKYFQFMLLISMAGISPLWSIFSTFFHQRKWEKINEYKRKFYLVFMGICAILLFQVLLYPMIFEYWLHSKLNISYTLVWTMAILVASRIFAMFFQYFLNGIGMLNSSVILLIFSALVKIPLTELFVSLSVGVSSVLLSSVICVLLWCMVYPFQVSFVIKSHKAV